jgi:serine protease inhibitor
VEVSLPRFEVKANLDLKPLLRKLGMRVAFTDQADLSGMDGKRDLFVNQARHGAWLRVDEKGTEAAAATAAEIALKSVPQPTARFQADHPFLFLLRDEVTGSILFLGQVVDPRP